MTTRPHRARLSVGCTPDAPIGPLSNLLLLTRVYSRNRYGCAVGGLWGAVSPPSASVCRMGHGCIDLRVWGTLWGVSIWLARPPLDGLLPY
eukprot:6597442-Pyramimonas_sp.AAC.2